MTARKTSRSLLLAVLLAGLLGAAPAAAPARTRPPVLTLHPKDRQPPKGRKAPTARELQQLRQAVQAAPRQRAAHFALVTGLINAGQLEQALSAARAWREHDAYNLVVVRLIGDIHTELQRLPEARRAYSAVVELLPEDAGAQRALAAVLKQAGQPKAAYQRMLVAATLRPEDTRIAFELADLAQRLGRSQEAVQRFKTIIAGSDTPAKIRYPAKQRLAQLYAAQRRRALQQHRTTTASRLARAMAALRVKGGAVNHIKVYLTWDTDRTDVDLWVVNPAGQKIFYSKKTGRFGGALYDDVTDGYGPESFTASSAARGTYLVQVNYFSTRHRTFPEARGEVVIILHEGTAREKRHTLPYRLFKPKQTVTVARIQVRR